MYQQANFIINRFRFLATGMLVIGYIILISALVTAIGAHSILNSRTHDATSITGSTSSVDPNSITATFSNMTAGGKRALLSTGTALYDGCHAVTTGASYGGQLMLHGIATIVHGIGSGVAFVFRGVNDGFAFLFRIPSRLVGSVASSQAVSAVIRPADNDQVPVISAETSDAILAHFDALQRQEIAKLQAAQVVANRKLGGEIVAGDPHHGGYPAKWDSLPQDSTLDSWGMYNRECVSYAAWKVYQTYGHMPYWGGVGNANQWVRDARNTGITTSRTPEVHSVAISMQGYYGHAMWVEAVSAGNMIYVSQYNYDLHGHYSEMWVNGSSLTYIYFK